MAYALDDGWDNCTPVARAGNACFGLYVRCGIWVARNLTDGFIPGEIAAAYGSPEQTRKLVDVGLWETVEGGYLAPDYLTLNPTAEKVRARRKADADRKARWRDRTTQRRTRDETRESERSHAVTDAVTPRSPAAPKGAGVARTRARDAPHPPTNRCPTCGNPTNSTYHRRVCAPTRPDPPPSTSSVVGPGPPITACPSCHAPTTEGEPHTCRWPDRGDAT